MSHGLSSYPLVIAVVALVGCSNHADSDSGSVDGGGADAGDAHAGDQTLQRRIDDAIESIQADTCFAQDDTSGCQWADYQIGPAEFDMAKSTGEAILVIDSFGEGLFPELLRYRNRLLGF
jgi:hypothetical protein